MEILTQIWTISGSFFASPSSPSLSVDKMDQYSTALRCMTFREKHLKKHLCSHDRNYYYFWKSNIPVIDLIVDSRNMIKVSKNMSLLKKNSESRFHQIPTIC